MGKYYVTYQNKSGSPTIVGLCEKRRRLHRLGPYLDIMDHNIQDKEEDNKNNTRPTGLQLKAQQPRLALKANEFQDKKTKTSEREEDVATDERMRDISFVPVHIDTISQTSFTNSAKPSDAPEKNIGDAMFDEASQRQSHVSPPWGCTHQNLPVTY